jgi:hypothetical protein
MSWRCWIELRDQAGNACFAAAIARSAAFASARAKSPTMSAVFEGLMSSAACVDASHSPAM